MEDALVSLDLSLIPLVHDYLSGKTLEQCAVIYALDIAQVSEFLNRREVKQFISAQLKNSGYVNKKRRIDLLARIVDQKIELADDNELPLSNKDLIEVLKLLREEENDLNKGSIEDIDTGKTAYINIINQLRMD